MNWRQLLVVFRKELTDHRRDRRALISASFGVIIAPLMIGLMLTQIAKDQNAAQDITIAISGAEHAPSLVQWLEQQAGVSTEEAPVDAEAAVRAGDRPARMARAPAETIGGMPASKIETFAASPSRPSSRQIRIAAIGAATSLRARPKPSGPKASRLILIVNW